MATFELPVGAAKSSRVLLGAIEIASPFEPAVVLENLRARGREWRESAVPEDLRQYKVTSLAVDVSGSEFSLRWVGNTSPLHNPVYFGSVETTGQGSRIHARFKRDLKALHPLFFLFPLAIVQVVSHQSAVTWLLLAAWLLILGSMARGSNRKGLLRARLIDVLTTAAQQRGTKGFPFANTMSTNGP